MEYWETENRSGLFIAGYKNPPTNYFIAAAATRVFRIAKNLETAGGKSNCSLWSS